MAILYYHVFCSALLEPSCDTPRNYFLPTDWDAVTAVSLSENYSGGSKKHHRYLNPGMPAKLNSSQLCKQARLIVTLSPTGGTITKTLFICRLFQWLMGLIQKWNALPQVMSHFQMLLGLAGLILIHPTDWLRRCPFIWEYTLVATRNIAGPLPLACLWSWTSQLCTGK